VTEGCNPITKNVAQAMGIWGPQWRERQEWDGRARGTDANGSGREQCRRETEEEMRGEGSRAAAG